MNEDKIRAMFNFGGVRIEDDVVVTKEGNEIMSAGVPKARDQIEALMATQ